MSAPSLQNTKLPVEGRATFDWAGGVDGDFAFPAVFVAAVANDGILIVEDSATLTFTDKATRGDAPEAATLIKKTVRFDDLPHPSSGATVEVLLRGVRIGMRCVEADQAPGDHCNSNGSWPIRMDVNIAPGCELTSSFEFTYLDCNITFEFNRGWTPSKGGGKPFNYRLEYNVQLDVSIFVADQGVMHSTPLGELHESGEIHDALAATARQAGGRGGNAFATAVVGLHGFGFELLETDGNARRGRYMERLMFAVTSPEGAYDPSLGTMTYSSMLVYGAPATVFASKVDKWIRPVLVQLGGASAAATSTASVNGTICFSSTAGATVPWSCSAHGFADRETITAPFSLG